MDKANSSIVGIYDMYLSRGDPRVANWFMMDTPFKTVAALIVYLILLHFIREHMANRKPFELKYFLILYNFIQVIGSFYIFAELLTVAYLSNYSLTCQPVDYSTNPLPMRMVSVLWYYYISKMVDLVDTLVFALRKKNNQITFLHVFHHFTMFPYGWIGLKFVGGGQTFFLCMLNSFVHTVMYAYYGFSAMGPHMQKYLWWKKYLTQLQLIQFFMVMTHSIVNIMTPDCPFPKGFSISYLVYGGIITAFFANFYIQSYIKSRSDARAAAAVNGKSKKDH